jgi:RHS repeat-associated protein
VAYDAAGNRLAMQNEQGNTDYAYDALHRLVAADPPGAAPAVHYGYDRAGNRTRSGQQDAGGAWTAPYQSYSYELAGAGGATHRLDEIRDAGGNLLEAFAYDANGNPGSWAAPTLRLLSWDTLDRLIAIAGGFSATYRYDPLGRRIEKTEAGQTLRYQYDGLDVVAEYSVATNGTNTLAASHVFGPGIDEPIKIRRGATLAAYHSDGLGSILAASSITPAGATDLLTYRYDAFGVIEASTGTLDSTYTYTGRELDASGLYYYRSRYYLPSAGRFLSPDPIGLAGGINPYAYVGSNPVNYTDPFGLVSMVPKNFSTVARAAPPLPPGLVGQRSQPGTGVSSTTSHGLVDPNGVLAEPAGASQRPYDRSSWRNDLIGSAGLAWGSQVAMLGPVPIAVWAAGEVNTSGRMSSEAGAGIGAGMIFGVTAQGGITVTAGTPGRLEAAFIAEAVIPGLGYGPVIDARVSLTSASARVQIGAVRGEGAFGFVGFVTQGPSADLSALYRSSRDFLNLLFQPPR